MRHAKRSNSLPNHSIRIPLCLHFNTALLNCRTLRSVWTGSESPRKPKYYPSETQYVGTTMAANNLAPALTPHLPRVDGGVGINSHRMRRMPSHWEKVIGHLRIFSNSVHLHTHLHNIHTQCLEPLYTQITVLYSLLLVGKNRCVCFSMGCGWWRLHCFLLLFQSLEMVESFSGRWCESANVNLEVYIF